MQAGVTNETARSSKLVLAGILVDRQQIQYKHMLQDLLCHRWLCFVRSHNVNLALSNV